MINKNIVRELFNAYEISVILLFGYLIIGLIIFYIFLRP